MTSYIEKMPCGVMTKKGKPCKNLAISCKYHKDRFTKGCVEEEEGETGNEGSCWNLFCSDPKAILDEDNRPRIKPETLFDSRIKRLAQFNAEKRRMDVDSDEKVPEPEDIRRPQEWVLSDFQKEKVENFKSQLYSLYPSPMDYLIAFSGNVAYNLQAKIVHWEYCIDGYCYIHYPVDSRCDEKTCIDVERECVIRCRCSQCHESSCMYDMSRNIKNNHCVNCVCDDCVCPMIRELREKGLVHRINKKKSLYGCYSHCKCN